MINKDEKNTKKRLEDLTEVLLNFSVMDFSKTAAINESGDEIDALAAGLNVMGQEMESLLSTQKRYTHQLEELNIKLKESNKKIQTILDNAPDAIIASDLNFNVTEWNKAAEKMYGFTREEVMGKPTKEFIKSDYISPFSREQALSELSKHEVWSGEMVQFTGKHEGMKVLSSAALLKNENGKNLGYLSINRDVTEIRKINEELYESEKRYHLLVNEVIDYAIIIIDANGIITTWNKGAERIKGYSENEIIGKHFSVFYRKEDIEDEIPEMALKKAKEDKRYVFQGWRVRKDKSLFWADVVITELIDEKGNLKGFVKITRDLSDRRKADEEIFRKSEELKRSNAELEQFAYIASHDLQEPLRMITSYVQLLEKNYKDKLDGDANDFINFAVDGANRMRTLIYSLLEYSRTNRIKAFEYLNLNDVLKEIMRDLTVSIKESNAKIISTELPVIYGDRVLIYQLFFNLIANAIKFRSESQPKIHITWKREADKYLFSIKDNGIGIKAEYFEKIFVIFQRLNSKAKYAGTGIGLAICKKIVERHEGEIWVESELNKGSNFYFTFNAFLKNPIDN